MEEACFPLWQGSNQQNGPYGQGSNQQNGSNGQGSNQQNGSNGQGSNQSSDPNGQSGNSPQLRGRPQHGRSAPRSPKTPTDTKLDDLDNYSRRLQRDEARRRATGRSSDPQHDW